MTVQQRSQETPSVAPRRLARAVLLLAIATALSLGGAAAILAFVFRADFLTDAAAFVVRVAFAHGALAAAAAASPLVAAMLVGYAYMQRGIRRRAAQQAAARLVAVGTGGEEQRPASSPSRSRRT